MSALRWSTTTGMRGCVWTLRGVRFSGTWTQGTNSGARPGSTEVPQIQFIDFVAHHHAPDHGDFWNMFCSLGLLELFALGKCAFFSPTSCIWQPFLGVWVLHVDYGTLVF